MFAEYALQYHGLIPERVDLVTSMTCNRKNFNTPVGRFRYTYLNKKDLRWVFGKRAR